MLTLSSSGRFSAKRGGFRGKWVRRRRAGAGTSPHRSKGRSRQKRRQAQVLLRRRALAAKRRWRLAVCAWQEEAARVTAALEAAASEELEGRGSWMAACQAAELAPSPWAERASWYRELITGWTGAAPFVWPVGSAVAASSLPFLSPAGTLERGASAEAATEDEALAALAEAVCSQYSAEVREGEAQSWEARALTALAAPYASRWHYHSSPPPTRLELLEAAHPVEGEALAQLRASYTSPRAQTGAQFCAAWVSRFALFFDFPHLPSHEQQVKLQVLILDLVEHGGDRHTYTPICFSERLLALDSAMFALGAPASQKEFDQ
jgi:hypothetical protein